MSNLPRKPNSGPYVVTYGNGSGYSTQRECHTWAEACSLMRRALIEGFTAIGPSIEGIEEAAKRIAAITAAQAGASGGVRIKTKGPDDFASHVCPAESSAVWNACVYEHERITEGLPPILSSTEVTPASPATVADPCIECGADPGKACYPNCCTQTPQPAAAQGGECNVEGTWLWGRLMDWCRMQGVPPSNYNELFAIARDAHKLFTPASPATGATLGVEGQMRLVAELANDMDEAHRAEQCTEFAKRLRAIFAPNWQTGAAHPQQAPAQETE